MSDETNTPEADEAPAVDEPTAVKADPKLTHATGVEWEFTSPFLTLAIDPTGRYVFAAGEDTTIGRWQIDGPKEPVVMTDHESWVRGIACSPDGERVYTCGCDERLIAWNNTVKGPTMLWTVDPAHAGWVRSVAVSPDGTTLATGGNDNLVKLWQADTGEAVAELAGHESHVYNLAYSPDGGRIISGDLKGVVIEWDATAGQELRRLDASAIYIYDKGFRADIGGLRAIAISPAGDRLSAAGVTNVTNAFAGVGNAAISLLDLADDEGKQLQLFKPKGNPNGVMWGVAHHPDGFIIGAAGGSSGGHLLFFREDAPEPFHELKLPNTVRAMSLHPDGVRIIVAHHDKKLRVYSMTAKPAEEKAEKKER